MRLAGHQPDYLPYPGFFARMLEVDAFLLVDHVQFEKKSFQSRNRIAGPHGQTLLSVPVRARGRFHQACAEVETADPEGRWRTKHWRSLVACYRSAPHFARHAAFFESLYARRWELLVDLNLAVIRYLRRCFAIETPLSRSGPLGLTGRKTALLTEMCRRTGADTYVSGPGGRLYVDDAELAAAGVASTYSTYRPVRYARGRLPFHPQLSAVDLLFHQGERAADLLRESVAPSSATTVPWSVPAARWPAGGKEETR
ncbi:WbqC family protein [Streptomyces sulphureus]|uniref:WbqC family protein n=1 Tax=Streptomyces sulphureus TaxID=47758 RepID=UPI000399C890|nr:WbqC family protein [Streptomyces sulphureus]